MTRARCYSVYFICLPRLLLVATCSFIIVRGAKLNGTRRPVGRILHQITTNHTTRAATTDRWVMEEKYDRVMEENTKQLINTYIISNITHTVY